MKMTARETLRTPRDQRRASDADKRRTPDRSHRRAEQAPVGFGHVMEQVGKEHKKGSTEECIAMLQNGADQPNGLLVTELVMETAMINTAKAVESTTLGLQAATAQQQTVQQQDAMLMTPRAALKFAATSAGTMTEGLRELHISLDPEHLGPILIKLRVENGPKGRKVSVHIAAETEEARAKLSPGSASLQRALAKLGFSEADVQIEHSPEDFEELHV